MSVCFGVASRQVVLLVVAVALLSVGCKKKPVEPPPPDMVIQSVQTSLQVTAVSPSSVPASQRVAARVFGSGFTDGATVTVGNQPAAEVKVVDPNTISLQTPALAAGQYDVTVTLASGEKSSLRSGLTVQGGDECRLVTVSFDFDSSSLRPDARAQLDGKLACLQQAGTSLRVEGHADERGTTDYNLALGQRRADAVSRHLTSAGVSGSRLKTMSFGEERPVDRASNEAAWAKNRRVEVKAE